MADYPNYLWEWRSVLKKNGKPGLRVEMVPIDCTVIYYCDVCGKVGPKKKVQQRNDVWGWNFDGPKDYKTQSKSMLCMGCWNKIRPLCVKQRKCDEMRTFINKLQRTISNERKQNNQDNGRAS
jgi:hypothetical protein